MKKIYGAGLTLLLGMGLFGCDSTSESTENANEGVIIEKKEVSENNQPESSIVLTTGTAETDVNIVEGMEVEVQVIHYEIQPFNIFYQLNETFDSPEVKQNQVIYSKQNEEYIITLEIFEYTDLESVVEQLQDSFETGLYEEIGELESTPVDENALRGKMQFFAYPKISGFYAYEVGEHVLVIIYEYPVEAGDGMGPLLEALRKSIHVP